MSTKTKKMKKKRKKEARKNNIMETTTSNNVEVFPKNSKETYELKSVSYTLIGGY